ncbi:hypothetical protein SAMN05216431_103156 [Ligilactobacillus sp. WC1T17]|uniref:Uncharacterized protein n=1 Tax=Ligilactobacillus ruminis TaxID=1623 RepID=A0ABY1AAE6_9LACO|nr:hypothetical protein SAMN05216431_103156 [Ligilactobacillus ruminis]
MGLIIMLLLFILGGGLLFLASQKKQFYQVELILGSILLISGIILAWPH